MSKIINVNLMSMLFAATKAPTDYNLLARRTRGMLSPKERLLCPF